MSDVTRILNAIEGGEAKATNEQLPLVYEELRLLAKQKLSHEPSGQTLQATALVHEAYLRLVGTDAYGWKSRAHFFGAAAEAMRRILVENARRKQSRKHGGKHTKVDIEDKDLAITIPSDDLIALDEALTKLAAEDSQRAELVKLRYFAGLSIDQAAEILGISRATAIRQWSFVRVWLFHEIGIDG